MLLEQGPVNLSQKITRVGAEADTKLGDAKTTGSYAICPFTIRLEHRSRYTARPRYSEQEWVAAKDFVFLIGQDRVLSKPSIGRVFSPLAPVLETSRWAPLCSGKPGSARGAADTALPPWLHSCR